MAKNNKQQSPGAPNTLVNRTFAVLLVIVFLPALAMLFSPRPIWPIVLVANSLVFVLITLTYYWLTRQWRHVGVAAVTGVVLIAALIWVTIKNH